MQNVKLILTDIEGTTSSISFVKDVLFPYAADHLPAFVKENINDEKVQTALQQTAELAAELVIPGTASEKLIGNVAEYGIKGAWKGASYFGGRFQGRL